MCVKRRAPVTRRSSFAPPSVSPLTAAPARVTATVAAAVAAPSIARRNALLIAEQIDDRSAIYIYI